MSHLKPLVLYASGPAPNPFKVVFILEELNLPYQIEQIEIEDVKKEPFLALNPNGRVPALVDPNRDITLWESGAIIDYLIDIYDTQALIHYRTEPEKYATRCWEHFQMSGQGPYFGQLGWFINYHPEKIPSAIERYKNEVRRVTGVLDTHLSKQGTGFLVGDRVTYADIMWIPYFYSMKKFMGDEFDFSSWNHYNTWFQRVCARPAVAKTLELLEVRLKERFGEN